MKRENKYLSKALLNRRNMKRSGKPDKIEWQSVEETERKRGRMTMRSQWMTVLVMTLKVTEEDEEERNDRHIVNMKKAY